MLRGAKALSLFLTCIGLGWGVMVLPSSQDADEFRLLLSQLLRSESFSPKALETKLDVSNAQTLSNCDTDAQLALLLIEMRLAESSLRKGDVAEFDQHAASLQARTKRALSCSPRQSFVWLMAFGLAVLHGQLDSSAFNLLALSYQTSPNEAWVGIRRNFLAVPVIQVLPEALAQQVLAEFQSLIRNGFEAEASRAFLRASCPVRKLLQTRVELLEEPRQEAFWRAVQQRGS